MDKETRYLNNAQILLKKFKLRKDYTRAELMEDLDWNDSDWKRAIQYLIKTGKVCQVGSKSQTAYRLKAPTTSLGISNNDKIKNSTNTVTNNNTYTETKITTTKQNTEEKTPEPPKKRLLFQSQEDRANFFGIPNTAATVMRAAQAAGNTHQKRNENNNNNNKNDNTINNNNNNGINTKNDNNNLDLPPNVGFAVRRRQKPVEQNPEQPQTESTKTLENTRSIAKNIQINPNTQKNTSTQNDALPYTSSNPTIKADQTKPTRIVAINNEPKNSQNREPSAKKLNAPKNHPNKQNLNTITPQVVVTKISPNNTTTKVLSTGKNENKENLNEYQKSRILVRRFISTNTEKSPEESPILSKNIKRVPQHIIAADTNRLNTDPKASKGFESDVLAAKAIAAKKQKITPHDLPVVGSIRNTPVPTSKTVTSRIYVNPKAQANTYFQKGHTLKSVFPEHDLDTFKNKNINNSQVNPLANNSPVKPKFEIKTIKITPLPIESFRNSSKHRFEITRDELHKQLQLTKDENILTTLICRELNLRFWKCLSAIANQGGGYLIVGIKNRNNFYTIKGIHKSSTLKDEILDKIRDKKLLSDNILTENDIQWAKIHKRNVLAIHIQKENIPQKPVFVGTNSFNTSPKEGTFKIENGEPVKCSNDEIKNLWTPYTAPFLTDWPKEELKYVREKIILNTNNPQDTAVNQKYDEHRPRMLKKINSINSINSNDKLNIQKQNDIPTNLIPNTQVLITQNSKSTDNTDLNIVTNAKQKTKSETKTQPKQRKINIEDKKQQSCLPFEQQNTTDIDITENQTSKNNTQPNIITTEQNNTIPAPQKTTSKIIPSKIEKIEKTDSIDTNQKDAQSMQNSLKSDEEFTSAAKLPNKIVAELMDIAESSRQFTRLHPLRQAEIFQNLCKIATAHGVALTLSELAAYMGRKEKNLKEKVLPLLDTQFTAVHKTDKNRYYFE